MSGTRLAAPLVMLALLIMSCSGTGAEDPGGVDAPSGTATGAPDTIDPSEPDDSAGEVDDGPTDTPQDPTGEGTGNPRDSGDSRTRLDGLDADLLDQARADVAELELDQLAGQLIVASYGGTDANAAAAMVSSHHLGGVITLGDNVPEVPADRLPALSDVSRRVHEAVSAGGRDWPAFVAIDQEGGPITRVGLPLDRWPSAMALGAAGDTELAEEVAFASGEQLRALGYTAVFAPVADVTAGPQDPTIGARSFGSDPPTVAAMARAQVDGYLAAEILPVVKHFPGHGSVPADTHLESVRQTAELAQLEERDLLPFRELADSGAPAMMTAHITVDAVDPDRPATLSEPVLTGVLREEFGYQGLVVTDAMNMAAISSRYGVGQASVLALQAGADVILMPPDPVVAIQAIVVAVDDGTLARSDLEDSAARMVAHLRSLDSEVPGPEVIGSRGDLARQAAAAAVTQISGPCGEVLISSGIRIVGGTEQDRAFFAEAAQAAGLRVGAGPTVALVGAPVYQAGGGGGDDGAGVSGDIVVALDVPYRLADSSASTAMFAIYGRDRAAFEALVAVLTGDAPAPGQLPVAVGELPIGSGC